MNEHLFNGELIFRTYLSAKNGGLIFYFIEKSDGCKIISGPTHFQFSRNHNILSDKSLRHYKLLDLIRNSNIFGPTQNKK